MKKNQIICPFYFHFGVYNTLKINFCMFDSFLFIYLFIYFFGSACLKSISRSSEYPNDAKIEIKLSIHNNDLVLTFKVSTQPHTQQAYVPIYVVVLAGVRGGLQISSLVS